MPGQPKKNKLLWIDDDSRDRFVSEIYFLTNIDNWEITWAPTVLEAMKILSEKSFKAIILDQMLPIEILLGATEVWGGCYLLHWLRNGRRIKSKYLNNQLERYPNLKNKKYTPLTANKTAKLLILSAFYDETVLAETRNANKQDNQLLFHSKPIDIELIRENLKGFLKEGENHA